MKHLLSIPDLAFTGMIIGALVWISSNFVTIREKSDLERRLDRIEQKLDVLINGKQSN